MSQNFWYLSEAIVVVIGAVITAIRFVHRHKIARGLREVTATEIELAIQEIRKILNDRFPEDEKEKEVP
jgi:uncharacterized membrane protein